MTLGYNDILLRADWANHKYIQEQNNILLMLAMELA